MSNNAFWLSLWLGLAAILSGTVACAITMEKYRDCVAMRNGYVMKTIPGHQHPVWTKEAAE